MKKLSKPKRFVSLLAVLVLLLCLLSIPVHAGETVLDGSSSDYQIEKAFDGKVEVSGTSPRTIKLTADTTPPPGDYLWRL